MSHSNNRVGTNTTAAVIAGDGLSSTAVAVSIILIGGVFDLRGAFLTTSSSLLDATSDLDVIWSAADFIEGTINLPIGTILTVTYTVTMEL